MSARPGFHSARVNKGHPRRQARRDRAAEWLAAHVHGPGCRPAQWQPDEEWIRASVRDTVTRYGDVLDALGDQ